MLVDDHAVVRVGFRLLLQAAEDLLALASPAAQREWEALRFQWPSEVDLRKGIIALSDDELELMRSKALRFVRILEAAGSTRTSNARVGRSS